MDSSAESLCCASFRSCGLFFSIPWRRVGLERMKKASRDISYLINRSQERGFVCFRRFVEPADLPDELERCGSNFIVRDRRIEVEKNFYIPAHSYDLEISESHAP